MRWSATVSTWTRWDTLLAAGAAVATAGAALSAPLGIAWLPTVGVVTALVFAVALLMVKVGKARVESRREQVESARRLRIPLTSITEVDPTTIGVDRAAQTVLAGGELPVYLPRVQDGELRRCIAHALGGAGRWLVVVVGPSKVGKSRTLFEALRAAANAPSRVAAGLQVLAPADGDALRALLLPGQAPRIRRGPVVLWLDDLEPFLNQGVTWQTLREWHASGHPERGEARIVAATYGGKGSDQITGSAGAGLSTTADEVLQHACEITLAATTSGEEAALPNHGSVDATGSAGLGVDAVDRATIRRFGLAAFLVAGPALERKLATGRIPGQDPCPTGLAVVEAVVDWARCGRTDAIVDALLRQIWPMYLPIGIDATDAAFAIGLAWALQPVAGSVALISGTSSYTAYDYVVQLRRQAPGSPPPREVTWEAAITTASPTQADAVGTAAYYASRLNDAARALTRAAAAELNPAIAARSGYNLGVVLSELGRVQEAIDVYARVVAEHGNNPAPQVREQVARALLNQGIRLRGLGRAEEAVGVFARLVAQYKDDPAPRLREEVARALINQAVGLRRLGRAEEAIGVVTRLAADYGDDPSALAREGMAAMLAEQGFWLEELGRPDEAVVVYARIVAKYGNDQGPPVVRQLVAEKLVNLGYVLGKLGRVNEAARAYARVVTDYGDDAAPEIHRMVVLARAQMGSLGSRSRNT
jgi:tetratricopeptide (TPR) repeat protein